MSITRSFKNAAQNALSRLPVIGPHADIEAELLLGGVKPLGWLNVWSLDGIPAGYLPAIKQYLDVQKLDKAVHEERLISYDVQGKSPTGDVLYTVRHYAQPDQKENIERIVAYHTKLWNGSGEEPDESILGDKSFGQYLGYRRQDEIFFDFLNSANLPKKIDEFLRCDLTSKWKTLYQDSLLRQAGIENPRQYWRETIETLKKIDEQRFDPGFKEEFNP